MRDVFRVHIGQSIEDLFGIVFDLFHRDRLFSFLRFSELVFKATLAILHHDVLDDALLSIDC